MKILVASVYTQVTRSNKSTAIQNGTHTTNLTDTCSLPPLQPPKDTSLSPLLYVPIFLGIAALGTFIYLIICFLFRYPRYKLVTDLRNTPSYQLHEKVERLYAYYHDLENDECFQTGPGGRIQSVRTDVDRDEMIRIVTVTEDLTREPGAMKVSRGERLRIEGSRSRGRQNERSRSRNVAPLPPPRRADQIPSLPLAADRTAWPEAPRLATPPEGPVAGAPTIQQTRIRFEAPAVVCNGPCGEVPELPPPAYSRRE